MIDKTKYQKKYRITSTRLRLWDYGWNRSYFITVCTKNRIHYFGEIIDNKMQLNKIGEITKSEWIKTFTLRPDMNLNMGEYIIMPNHFHAIISLGNNKYNTVSKKQRGDAMQRRDAMHCVSTACPAYSTPASPKNKFGPQSKNLASIVRGFKIGVTKNARKINPTFMWQSRFYDHIIRNEESFQEITKYIRNNPQNWKDDRFYQSHK